MTRLEAPMPPFRAIFWDVGGTLFVDGVKPITSIRNRLIAAGVADSSISDDHIASTLEVFMQKERDWRTIEDEHRDSVQWAQKLLGSEASSKIIQALADYSDLFVPVEGIYDLLHELQQAGIAQAVVSNWPPSLPRILKRHRLDHYFSPIVFSAEDGIHKPDPRIFQRAMKHLELSPKDVLFVGDNPEWDIIPTRAMGMRAIHFDPRRRYAERDAETVPELRKLMGLG